MLENIQLSSVLPSRLLRLETYSVKAHSLEHQSKDSYVYLNNLIMLNFIVLQAFQMLQVT